MKATLTAGLIAALAAPAMAGGPVIVEEEAEVVAEKPGSANLLVPILILAAIGLVVASGDDSDRPVNTRR